MIRNRERSERDKALILQRLTLTFVYVGNRISQVLVSPKIFLAASTSPWAQITSPRPSISHRPRAARLQRSQHPPDIMVSCDDAVNVIGSCVERPQAPFAQSAESLDPSFGCASLDMIQSYRRLFEQTALDKFAAWTCWQSGSPINSMMAIHGAALVTMHPSPVRTEGNQITKRRVVIVEFSMAQRNCFLP